MKRIIVKAKTLMKDDNFYKIDYGYSGIGIIYKVQYPELMSCDVTMDALHSLYPSADFSAYKLVELTITTDDIQI